MPALTRGAAARLHRAQPVAAPGASTDTAEISECVLGLREGVHHLADAVWTSREGRDAYTRSVRADVVVATPQVDHVLEVQFAEHALVHAMREAGVGAGGVSMAAAQSAQTLRRALNTVHNLNVTTARVNQAKRGPFTAAMNRVRAAEARGGSLRLVTLEQLARQGKARWLVDDGTWAAIEREVVCSYDAFYTAVEEEADEGLRSATALSAAALEELGVTLARLGVV
jgi:hypothetical protein